MEEDKKQSVQDALFNFAADLPKERALQLCSGHLQGSWLSLTEDDIDLSVVPAGVLNRIFLCQNKKSGEKVIIRLYGKTSGSVRSHPIETEVLAFHLLDVNKVGPRLLGVFDGGRIEEYLEGHTVNNEDCKNDELMGIFARKLAKMHSLEVPFDKNPNDFLGITKANLEKNLESFIQLMKQEEVPPESKEKVEMSYNYDWMGLFGWFEKTLPKIKTRSVFSHCDMNRANFMVVPDSPEKIIFLDFEFSGYSHRGCDIGGHFMCRTIDVSKYCEEGKNPFDIGVEYPKEEERRFFIREYLKVATNLYKDVDESIDNENHLLMEAEFFNGLVLLFLTSRMIGDVKQILSPDHPGVMIAGFIKDIEERRKNVIDLNNRFFGLALD